MIVFFLLSQAKPLPTVDTVPGPNNPVLHFTSSGGTPFVDLSAVPQLFSNILAVAVALIGLASFVMLVSGGLKFLTSGGDPKGVEQAKHTITWAVAGLVLTIMSYLIMMYLGNFLGVNLLQFVWPS